MRNIFQNKTIKPILTPEPVEEVRVTSEAPLPRVPIRLSRCFPTSENAYFEIPAPPLGRRYVITSLHGSFSARHVGLLSFRVGKQYPMQFYCHSQRDVPLQVEMEEGEGFAATLAFNSDDRAQKSASLSVFGYEEDV